MSTSDEDIDDLLLGTVGKSSKKTVTDFSSSSEDDDDGPKSHGDVFVHPYPLDGQYKDSADRDRILAMSEIEREEILYDRSKEVDQLKEKERLAARLKQRNAQAASDAKNIAARRSQRDAAAAKLSAMQELKRKREARSNKSSAGPDEAVIKRSKRNYYSSDESEDDEDDEGVVSSNDEYDTPATRLAEDKERAKREREAQDIEGSKPITFADALQIRFSRKSCLKFMYYPQFSETAINCFVRISIKSSDGRPKYRLCQVHRVMENSVTYKLATGEPCKGAFECAHGANRKPFDFTFISDSVFTEEEFDTWRDTMNRDQLPLMNRRRMKAKVQALQEMGDHRLTDSEINVMIEKKRELSKIPRNVAAEKIRLTGLIAEARDNGRKEEMEKYQNDLAKLEELTANRGRNGDLDRLSKLNERNRQQNLKSVGKAEVENMNKRQQAELLGRSAGDPFSRLKTKPRTFYESTPNSSAPGSPMISATAASSDLLSKEPASASKVKRLGGIDSLIGNIDIDLDL